MADNEDLEMDMEVDLPPVKRFKHQSYKASLQGVHLPSPLSQSHQPHLDEDIPDTSSQFYVALQHARQLSLAPTYIRFANKVDPLAQSMPLLLLNWPEILAAWATAVEEGGEGTGTLVELLYPLISDLRTTLLPSYPAVLAQLLALLPRAQAISAETLARLMRTLGALWKWVLVPALPAPAGAGLLRATWDALAHTLARCAPEVQRALAEVWGAGVLRRLKADAGARRGAVEMLAACVRDGRGMEDLCAWSLVYACQSVTQTLHTCTPAIVDALLDYHLAAPPAAPGGGDARVARLVRRVLTALLHHCKTGAQFAAVGDALVARFERLVGALAPADSGAGAAWEQERLRRAMEAVFVACSVRQGSRMSLKHLTALATCIPPLLPAHAHAALVRLAAALLAAGDMALWLGAGRKILAASWEVSSPAPSDFDPGSGSTPEQDAGTAKCAFALALHGALADPALAWGGWRAVGLPLVAHAITGSAAAPSLLDAEPRRFGAFLARLARAGRLGEGEGDAWAARLGRWVEARLAAWDAGAAGAVEELGVLLALARFAGAEAEVGGCLRGIVRRGLDAGARADADAAWVVGATLSALAAVWGRAGGADGAGAEVAEWVQRAAEKFAGSHIVLCGLVDVVNASPAPPTKIPLHPLYAHLAPALLSHARALRLGALRLLASPALVAASAGERAVLARALQGEEAALDVQGVRARVLRIGRVAHGVRAEDGLGAEICARWLVAQLKVNLRPLWSPAAEALAALAQRFGGLVWALVFSELKAAAQGHAAVVEDGDGDGDGDGDDDEAPEDERAWRDPSAHLLRAAVGRWARDDHLRREITRDQTAEERFSQSSYEAQLLAALGVAPMLAEKHSRDLVPLFLSLAGPGSLAKLPRHKMTAWLTLFSQFANPKALCSAEALHALYRDLLAHPDRALQRLALTCVLAYKSPRLAPHANRLHALLDDNRWREELTALDIGTLELQDRSELVDVLVRLLFGMMLEKRGRSRGADRRAAVLGTLGGCTDAELGLLVDLMLRPMQSHSLARRDGDFALRPVPAGVSEKQQIGFLTLLGDVLKHLGPRLVSYWPALVGTTLDLASHAHARIDSAQLSADAEEIGDEGEDEAEDLDEADESHSPSKITRSVRQLGLKRFADFFRNPEPFDFRPYMRESFRALISPRLPTLDKENTQAPSALLELFYAWTLERDHVRFLVQFDQRTLPQMYACLIATNVKPAVVSRIFDVVDRVLAYSTADDFIATQIVQPHASLLLTNLSILVERSKGVAAVSSPLGQRQIGILSELAQYLTDATQAATLLGLFSPLLRKPSKLVAEKVKINLLKIISNLLALIPDLADRRSAVFAKTYDLLARLFQSLRFSQARTALVATFNRLADISPSLLSLAQLLESLNAFSTRRIDEPDFDRRLDAFATLNETSYLSLDTQDWLAVLYNMLSFIQDTNELAVRNNAAYTLKHFVDLVATSPDAEYEALFMRMLYPGLKNGLRSKNELVRAEILGVIAYAVTKCDNISFLHEMRVLLAGGDEEANFFNNIHHVQIHRRTRALRRLGDQCDEGLLRSTTLADIFVPLVGNYIVTAASLDHHLVNEAILTTGRMAKQLVWGAYYALVQRYLKSSRDRDESERVYVRTLVAILENFHFPMEEIVPPEVPEAAEAPEDDEVEDVEEEAVAPATSARPMDVGKIADAVNLRLLPNLLHHLEKRDITEDSLRIPISIGIVKVAKHLPPATREPQIARLLTILSQILRSKSQETRDLVKDTMCRIAVVVGPAYLSVMVREMRGALLRGPQLHVLAYVAHALLVHVTSAEQGESFQTLDDIVDDVAHISAEVVFGQSGKDVQSEDFKTKMREVRSSSAKGLDSFAVMAKYITPSKISGLLFPLRSIMQETQSVKAIQLVEEVLRRVASGLNSNKHLGPAELLVLCHTLVSQNARFLTDAPSSKKRKGHVKPDAIVQIKRKVAVDADHYSNNSFRFVVFGLDLFNTAFRRGRFDFQDAAIIARLEPMVPVIGNTLYSNNALVITSGMKSAAAVVKAPLKTLDKSIPIFLRQIIDIIKQTGSTESDTVQTAFKSLAIILRDCPVAQVKEKDLVYLLELLSPDLEEPTRQAAVFSMLRAIVARKFVVPEIYDLMDKISEIMVTNQSKQVQELCRSVLLQFLLDYPQGKGRLRNQMTFMAKNLSYVFESGRKSVMELLSVILAKFEVGLVREYADLLFVGLVMVIANDDSAKCREMAAELIKNLILRLDDNHRKIIMSHLHSWALQQSQAQLARVSSQVYGLVIDVLQQDSLPYIPTMLEDVNTALGSSKQTFESMGEDVTDMETDLEWQATYHALIVQSKVLRVLPEFVTQPDAINWDLIIGHLLFPHAWVRSASCRLLGLLFTDVPVSAPNLDLPPTSPFSSLGMREVAQKLCLQLKSEHLDAPLSLQVVKNLLYIGKCLYAVPLPLAKEDALDEAQEEEEEEGPMEPDGDVKDRNPLPWLFSKLSYQARSAHISRRNRTFSGVNWAHQPLSILRWFAAMASHMDTDRLESFLVHILTPVYRITEDDTIRDAQMDELKTLAVELQDLVQAKVGTTKFANTYSRIRQGVITVRRDRKTARVLQVTTDPQAAAKRKLQKNTIKKDSRKRKNKAFADNKGRIKRRREDE